MCKMLPTLAVAAILFVCACPIKQSLGTPSTFVAAWTASGGRITTLESTDGLTWFARRVHATTARTDLGPAIAHDGDLSWMLMWADGPEMLFKTALGGTVREAGMNWESNVNQGRLVVRPEGSPALAFGAGRWVVVFPRIGEQLQFVRSQAGGHTNWDPPVDLQHPLGRPAQSRLAPALAFGNIGGRNVFVLAYVRPNPSFEVNVSLSPDGSTWSNPVIATGAVGKAPALAVRDGQIFLMVSQGIRGGYQNVLFQSADGLTFREIERQTLAPLNPAGPALAYGACTLVEIEQWSGTPTALLHDAGTAVPCTQTAAVRFVDRVPLRAENATNPESAAGPASRPALAFGQSGNAPEVDRTVDTDCRPIAPGGAPRPLATTPLEAHFEGEVTAVTTDSDAPGPYNRRFRVGLLFSRSRCEVQITRLDTVCFPVSNLPVVGNICVRVSRVSSRVGRFFPVTGALSIPVTLRFTYGVALAGDDEIELTLSTETRDQQSGFAGSRLNTSNGTQLTGTLTAVGAGQFRNGFLGGSTGVFRVRGDLREGAQTAGPEPCCR